MNRAEPNLTQSEHDKSDYKVYGTCNLINLNQEKYNKSDQRTEYILTYTIDLDFTVGMKSIFHCRLLLVAEYPTTVRYISVKLLF